MREATTIETATTLGTRRAIQACRERRSEIKSELDTLASATERIGREIERLEQEPESQRRDIRQRALEVELAEVSAQMRERTSELEVINRVQQRAGGTS